MMFKTLAVIFAIATLVIGLPAVVFAHEGENDDSSGPGEEIRVIAKEERVVASASRTAIQAAVAERKEAEKSFKEALSLLKAGRANTSKEAFKEAIEKIKAEREASKEKFKEAIEAAKAKRAEARELLKQAREQAKSDFDSSKSALDELKDDLKGCRGNQSDVCNLVRQHAKIQSREFLLSAADRIVIALEQAKERVAASSIPEDEKTLVISLLDARISVVKEASKKAEALTENSTPEEVREAAKAIREAAKAAFVSLNSGTGRLMNEKIHGVLVRSEQLKQKLEDRISKLKERGFDVSTIEDLKANFDAKLAEARTNYESAVEKLKNALVPGATDETMKAANAALKAAQKALQDAHQILKDIVAKIREREEQAPLKASQKELEDTNQTLKPRHDVATSPIRSMR
ncbi:MAG: hypothetical protein QW559_03395 [Candidatus Woesearchaeota archaeon]